MGKLGQLLVARGWITVQQLTRALQTQHTVGGRLGTCLLEMEVLGEELLARALAEQLGVPAADPDELRNVPQEVLGLIPEKLARRCRAVPFRLAGGRLDIAMLDPRNLACQDEMAFACGKRLKVHVVQEVRICEALGMYYREECPSRYNVLLDRLNRARFQWAESVAGQMAGTAGQAPLPPVQVLSPLPDDDRREDTQPLRPPPLPKAPPSRRSRPGVAAPPRLPPLADVDLQKPVGDWRAAASAQGPPLPLRPAVSAPGTPAGQGPGGSNPTAGQGPGGSNPTGQGPGAIHPPPGLEQPVPSSSRAQAPSRPLGAAAEAAVQPAPPAGAQPKPPSATATNPGRPPAPPPPSSQVIALTAAERAALGLGNTELAGFRQAGSEAPSPGATPPASAAAGKFTLPAPPAPPPLLARAGNRTPVATAPSAAPAPLEEVEAALAATSDREEVGRILLGFLARDFRRVALFQASRQRVTGWMAHGEGIDRDAFGRFAVEFDEPSVFLNLRQGSSLHLGALPPMAAHHELALTWGGGLPRDCVVLPVRLKERLVMVIYVDGGSRGSAVDLERMRRLIAVTGAAFERCIISKKRAYP
ncbi:MAG TPA: hypothetical protein VHQ90_19225 [Thermoanaerobaculia bacterium]|nr:hypothetical protein [Thermoanaerobaculia bacterium]